MKRKKSWSWYRRMATLGLAGSLLAALVTPATPAMAAPPGPLDSRIELAVKDANPEELFASIGRMMSAEVVLEEGLAGSMASKVSIELHNVRVRTILDALCESAGCQWTFDSLARPPKLRVTPRPSEPRPDPMGKQALPKDPIDLKITEANVQEVLQTFGAILEAKAIVDPAIQGKLSLSLENTPLDQALSAVCAAAGCDWSYDAAAKILRVTPLRRK